MLKTTTWKEERDRKYSTCWTEERLQETEAWKEEMGTKYNGVWTEERLRDLFDQQIERLEYFEAPLTVIKRLMAKKDAVIEKASQMTFLPGRIPFLPVIPPNHCPEKDQVEWVRTVIGTAYKTNLYYLQRPWHYQFTGRGLERISHSKKGAPYYIFDINDGGDVLNVFWLNALKLLEQQHLLCLNFCEFVALCIHTKHVFCNYKGPPRPVLNRGNRVLGVSGSIHDDYYFENIYSFRDLGPALCKRRG